MRQSLNQRPEIRAIMCENRLRSHAFGREEHALGVPITSILTKLRFFVLRYLICITRSVSSLGHGVAISLLLACLTSRSPIMSLDLSTNFGGLVLRSPIMVAACPLTANVQNRIAMESAGVGAMVLPSLFEEQVVAWKAKHSGVVTPREQRVLDHAEGVTRNSAIPDAQTYLAMVNCASVQSSVPIIASLNGQTDGDWLDFAGELQEAGADAIEFSVHHRPLNQYDDPREIETEVADFARRIDASITVPLFLKLHREYTSVSHLARRLVSGCQGLVLFARDPEIDISLDDCSVQTSWQLSQSGFLSPMIRALMSVYGSCPSMPLVGSGGIGSSQDLIKVLLGGADAAMVCSAVYREGPDVIRKMLDGLTRFMEHNRIRTLNELQAKRPLEFSGEQDRMNMINGLQTRPEVIRARATHTHPMTPTWG